LPHDLSAESCAAVSLYLHQSRSSIVVDEEVVKRPAAATILVVTYTED
jgi:hypothetical protein